MAGSPEIDVRRIAGWLPDNQEPLEAWLRGARNRLAERTEARPLDPSLVELRKLIDGDPVLRLYAHEMINQVPSTKQYSERHLESIDHMLQLINEVLNTAPEFSSDAMVMTPIGAILDWTMATPAGFAFYRDPRVNAAIRGVLQAWCRFLDSPDSRYVINESDSGWKSSDARDAIGIDQFEHDPDDQYWGFGSWNDFFTRGFKSDMRPVAGVGDDSVIVSACESTPYGLATGIQLRDRFWVKSQPYSLHDLLAGDESAAQFVDGTIYQAFLSATNYHRWHSPVAGTVVRAFVQPGTYYSEADSEGSDAVEPQHSQSYLAHVATRAIILIQADNPNIGLVAVVLIGMSDVSSCVIGESTAPGVHIDKGSEIGYFQFGGSSHCLIFEPGVILDFALAAVPQPHLPKPPLVKVNTALAKTRPT